MTQNYSDYYSAIDLNVKGFKPVYGATGLGKTYGIKKYIEKTLKNNPHQKFIYITNRHALIQELYKGLQNDLGLKVSYVKGKTEQLRELQDTKQLQSIIDRLFNKNFFQYEIDESQTSLKEFFNRKIKNITSKEKDFKDNPTAFFLKEEIERMYQQLLYKLRGQFFLIKQKNKSLFKHFLNDDDIWQLFPFIQFENDEQTNVLVGTIQKFCYGYFNGKNFSKLHSLKHRDEGQNYVIFLDEFDFLENEILNILCQEPQLQNSIEFIRFFMEDFEDLGGDDFWDKQKGLKTVKERMQKIYDYLQSKIDKYGFHFPQNRRFIFDEYEFKTKLKQQFVLFQNNNHPLVSESFYLEQSPKSRKFKIVKSRNENTVNSFVFFGMIKSATEQLLRTFDSIRDRGLLMEDLIHQFWNTKNDNEKGEYHRYISENYSYRAIKSKRRSSQDEKFNYHSGFSLITLKKGKSIAPNLATVEQLELITSPEAIIAELADNNLVFALSATTDIPRMVSSFDMQWLKENVNFIEPSKSDYALIQNLKKDKQDKRKSQVHYQTNKLLDKKHPLFEVVKVLSKTGYYTKAGETDKSKELRIELTRKFLGCFDWIAKESKNRTHLIFSNTFQKELAFFDTVKMNNLAKKKLIQTGFISQKMDIGYKLAYEGKNINVIFLDAKQNKQLDLNPELQKQYDELFLDKNADNVILVTQYATASNGLNLRCLHPITKKEIDFEGIHLLEARHFWFDTDISDKTKALNNKKKVFWYFWKLYKNGEIGAHTFENFLKKTNLKDFNNEYKNTREYILNQMALFHQALGRVDRKRQELPLVEITLGKDVYEIFVDFLTLPIYQEKEEIVDRSKLTATFILQLNEAIRKSARKEEFKAELSPVEFISEQQSESKRQIRYLLDEIKQINLKKYDKKKSEKIIQTWKEIREYVLKQDKSAVLGTLEGREIDFNNLTFETKLLQEDSKLFISIEDFAIYPEKFKIKDEIVVWDLNSPYNYINQNTLLKDDFKHLGYPTIFQKQPYSVQKTFTPYIHQAILRGAIGEEAIQCLLAHEELFCDKDDNYPISLFELFDAKLKDYPIYFDFKNFSKRTQDLFGLIAEDPFYDQDFDSENFLQKVSRKLKTIITETNQNDARYIVLNFVASNDKVTKFFDIELNPKDYFEDAQIIIVPSSITDNKPNDTSLEFKKLVQSLKNIQN